MLLQEVLELAIQLQERQRFTVAVAVQLGMAVQVVGLVQAALAAAGKEQTARAVVPTELQILVVVAVLAMSMLAAMVEPELSLFDTEFRMDLPYFHLMQMAVQVPRQQYLLQLEVQ
jgi:hypothetical protein